MKRDIELERKILFEIEDKYQPGHLIIRDFSVDGYSRGLVAEHCRLLFEQGLISDYSPLDDGRGELITFTISDLTAHGYDFLEMIRKESDWKKIIKKVEEKELPKTTGNIAKVAGIFFGNAMKEMSGLP